MSQYGEGARAQRDIGMSANTTATAGAVRAAEAIAEVYYPLLRDSHSSETYVSSKIAAIIDRETGAADLLAALEACLRVSKELRAAYGEMIGTDDEPCWMRDLIATAQQARAAIARARGTAE